MSEEPPDMDASRINHGLIRRRLATVDVEDEYFRQALARLEYLVERARRNAKADARWIPYREAIESLMHDFCAKIKRANASRDIITPRRSCQC
jgi:hypothetical protein